MSAGGSPIDEAVLASIVALGEPEGQNLLRELSEMFVASEAPACLDRIERALAEADAPEVCEGAHKLKGSAGMLGALGLRDLCLSLETRARDGDLSDGEGLLASIRAEVDAVSEYLQERCLTPRS